MVASEKCQNVALEIKDNVESIERLLQIANGRQFEKYHVTKYSAQRPTRSCLPHVKLIFVFLLYVMTLDILHKKCRTTLQILPNLFVLH